MSNEKYRDMIKEALKVSIRKDIDNSSWTNFAQKLYYTSFDFTVSRSYIDLLKKNMPSLEKKHGTGGNRIFYLAIPPTVFEDVITNIGRSGLSGEDTGYAHVVIEKPFGRDYDSAKGLNTIIQQFEALYENFKKSF